MIIFSALSDNPKEQEKLETLYILYKKRMWYTANKILNDPYDSEDAVQNSFVGIAKNLDHIGDPKSPATLAYVITVAKNCALNIAMRDNSKKAVPLEEIQNIPDDKTIYDFCSVENKELVSDVLRQMPDLYRDLLYLHYCRGMSEKAISTALNRKYPTVRQQISRGKKMFVELMEKEVGTDE